MSISAIVRCHHDVCFESSFIRKKLQNIFWEKSFVLQCAENRFFPLPLRDYILAGRFPMPEAGESSKPFNGSCRELEALIETTVFSLRNHLDFNGVAFFLRCLDQMEKNEIVIPLEKGSGDICEGYSHTLLKELKEKHNIEGSLAFLRNSEPPRYLRHEAIVIECTDGYVLVDWPNPNPILSVPFEQSREVQDNIGMNYTLTASAKGSFIPFKLGKNKEYAINIANGDDMILKYRFVETSLPGKGVYISFYNLGGLLFKSILLIPSEAKIVFGDFQECSSSEISFASIRKEGIFPKLKAFLEANIELVHTDLETLSRQIGRFVEQEERIKELFQRCEWLAHFKYQ